MADEGALVALRLVRGCRCFVASSGDELIGYGWLSTSSEWIGEVELEITPSAGEAYVWNCVTLLDHRRQGVFRTLLGRVNEIARREGLTRLWIGSMEDPAEKAVIDAGFIRVLDFEVAHSSGMRNLTVRAVHGAAPGLVVDARKALGLGGRMLPLGATSERSQTRRH